MTFAIENVEPADLANLEPDATISFDIHRTGTGGIGVIVGTFVWVVIANTDQTEVVNIGADGGFQGKYLGMSNFTVVDSTRVTIILRRAGGWPSGKITLRVIAVDDAGGKATL